jgi:hypothetical protein
MARPAHPKRDPEVAVLVVDAISNLVERRTTTLEGHGFQDYTAADGPAPNPAAVDRASAGAARRVTRLCGRTGGLAVAINEAPR